MRREAKLSKMLQVTENGCRKSCFERFFPGKPVLGPLPWWARMNTHTEVRNTRWRRIAWLCDAEKASQDALC